MLLSYLETLLLKMSLKQGTTVAVSLALAIIGRLSPYDYYQCPPDGFSLWESRFQMKLFNSVWQTLSAVLQQGNNVVINY